MTYIHGMPKRMIICDSCVGPKKNALSMKDVPRSALIGVAKERGWFYSPADPKNMKGAWHHYCPVCVEAAFDNKDKAMLTRMSGTEYATKICG